MSKKSSISRDKYTKHIEESQLKKILFQTKSKTKKIKFFDESTQSKNPRFVRYLSVEEGDQMNHNNRTHNIDFVGDKVCVENNKSQTFICELEENKYIAILHDLLMKTRIIQN